MPNISASTTRIQVNGLLSGIAYECCVNAHLLTNTPLDLISSHCATTKTKSDKLPGCEDQWIQVGRLLPSTAYECCVNAHILTNTPLDLISSSCVTTKTESLQEQPSDAWFGPWTRDGSRHLLSTASSRHTSGVIHNQQNKMFKAQFYNTSNHKYKRVCTVSKYLTQK